MKKRTQIILIIAIIGAIVGTIAKISSYKTIGDIFLGVSTILWLYFIYTFIFQFINKKQLL